MKYLFSVILVALALANIEAQIPEVKVYKEFDVLAEEIMQVNDEKVHLINFWATWCKPCVKELPYIDAMTAQYGDKIKVTLVSLDFPRQMDTKLIPFIMQNRLQSEVVLLDDGHTNEWIDKVDSSWSGAIPATVLLYKDKKDFYEQEFHSASELDEIINNITNQ